MFAVSLIFSGIAFFLNGFLPLVEENDNKEIVVMNVLSGIIVTVLSIVGIITSTVTGLYLAYSTLLLFGITHLYISAICIWDLSEQALGWFSALLAVITLAVGLYYIFGGNLMLGVMWLVWMLIWVAYFVSRALDVLHTASSWIIMLEGIIALCAVGILIITNFVSFNFA